MIERHSEPESEKPNPQLTVFTFAMPLNTLASRSKAVAEGEGTTAFEASHRLLNGKKAFAKK
jgi:hypothetical protein